MKDQRISDLEGVLMQHTEKLKQFERGKTKSEYYNYSRKEKQIVKNTSGKKILENKNGNSPILAKLVIPGYVTRIDMNLLK